MIIKPEESNQSCRYYGKAHPRTSLGLTMWSTESSDILGQSLCQYSWTDWHHTEGILGISSLKGKQCCKDQAWKLSFFIWPVHASCFSTGHPWSLLSGDLETHKLRLFSTVLCVTSMCIDHCSPILSSL
jgi:hypothetical protein